MPKFNYVAIDPSGRQGRGHRSERRARSRARNDLLGREYQVVEGRSASASPRSRSPPKKVKRAELMHFSRQLAAFVRAGIPILDAVRGARARRPPTSRCSRMLVDVEDGLRAGRRSRTASTGTRRCSRATTAASCARPSSPATSTPCSTSCREYLERDLEARRKIKSALIYPAIIVGDVARHRRVLAGFVLPQFKDVLREPRRRAAAADRGCCSASPTSSSNWWWLLAGVVVVARRWSSLSLAQTETGPVRPRPAAPEAAGDRRRRSSTRSSSGSAGSSARWSSAGVPLPEALAVATESLQQPGLHRAASAHAREQMLRGRGPRRAARATPGCSRRRGRR